MFSLRKRRRENTVKFIAFIVLSFSIILYQQFYRESANKTLLSVYTVVSPITNITRQPSVVLENNLKNISFYFNAVKENKLLKAENSKLKEHYRKSLSFISENQELRYLMNMAQFVESETVTASVYLDSSNLYANSFIIDKGSNSNIKPGFAALTSEGLVGRVLEVNEKTSRVLLIDDYNAAIPIRVLENGVQGILRGSNDHRKLTLITKEVESGVQEGQHVVSSSVQGLFDDGIPVGVISKVNKNSIEVAPYANLNRVHKVLIVKR